MNVKFKFSCSECHHELECVSTYSEDVDGFVAVSVEVEPCESCAVDAAQQKLEEMK